MNDRKSDHSELTTVTKSTDKIGGALAASGVSGLYATHGSIPGLVEVAAAIDDAAAAPAFGLQGEELRLDIDGPYPQMTASGTVPISPLQRVHWIAALSSTGPNQYSGGIWYKDPNPSPFTYTNVQISVVAPGLPLLRKAIVTFSGGGLADRTRKFRFKSPYFHKVEFEFDSESGVAPVVEIGTRAHAACPPALPDENLTIQTVFRRAGFDVRTSGDGGQLPVTGTGPGTGGLWSDSEMHDAMTVYWSRFANQSQWAMWVLFARQHEWGSGLGGIMFDDIGPNHRQGTALFYESFISDLPPTDPEADAWVARMRFWTAIHEMGHAFNLAHSWQKSLGTPWIPLADEPLALSFMNYPHSGSFPSPEAFFTDFEHRFSDGELLFMRHAPGRFVQMGNADWFDNHGLRALSRHPNPPLALEIRVNRGARVFDFLEPITAELKLKNISTAPQIVDEHMLTTLDGITIVVKRQGSDAREYRPFARYCTRPKAKVLTPGESLYDSVFLSAGLNGMDIAEPGNYTIYAVLHQAGGAIVSPALQLRVTPGTLEQERLAQDLFSTDVGRVLAFDGSSIDEYAAAKDALRAAVDQFPDTPIARHAAIALNQPAAKPRRVLTLPEGSKHMSSAYSRKGALEYRSADGARARKELQEALTKEPDKAAHTLGHIDLRYYADGLTDVLEQQGETADAARVQKVLYDILAARGVAAHVLAQIKAKRERYNAAGGGQ